MVNLEPTVWCGIMYVVCLVLGSIDVFHSVQTSFRLQLLSRAFALPYVPRIRM
jgi:hypothetical protein